MLKIWIEGLPEEVADFVLLLRDHKGLDVWSERGVVVDFGRRPVADEVPRDYVCCCVAVATVGRVERPRVALPEAHNRMEKDARLAFADGLLPGLGVSDDGE